MKNGVLAKLFFGMGQSLHVFFGMRGCCRFQPTCSRYAETAIATYGIKRGFPLVVKRLLRCHPLSGSWGLDPLPVLESRGAR